MSKLKVDRKLRVLEASERSGEGSKIGGGAGHAQSGPPPDPEVPAKATRRRFTASYKLKVLRQADECGPGEQSALLRREGLYWSNLQSWRRQRQEGTLRALTPKKRGRKAQEKNPLSKQVKCLNRENRRLKRRLEQAELMLEIQKKVSQALGITLGASEEEGES